MNVLRGIFHHPLPLRDSAKSASGIRPMQMYKAFQRLGCEMELVAGCSKERAQKIKKIKARFPDDQHFQFLYAENSTMPTMLADSHHLPFRPWMDFAFFRNCKKKGMQIGLFYRDIHWKFKFYRNNLGLIPWLVAQGAHQIELHFNLKIFHKIYLPTNAMAAYFPRDNSQLFSSLPPGHAHPVPDPKQPGVCPRGNPIRCIYMGGIGNHYRMHKTVAAFRNHPRLQLTLCLREPEWRAVSHEYGALTENIQVVHADEKSLKKFLAQADVGLILVEPHEYWSLANPLKLYEYLGAGKPIAATRGIWAGDFVQSSQVGWGVEYNDQELDLFLRRLAEDGSEWRTMALSAARVAREHTWEERARQVLRDLAPSK